MNYTITPLSNRVLVKPIHEDTEGDLLIPDSSKEKPQKGTIMAVGEGLPDKPMMSKIGQVTLYRKGAGIPIPGTDGWLMMIEGTDTIALLDTDRSEELHRWRSPDEVMSWQKDHGMKP